MKYNGNARLYGWFYHSACKNGMKHMGRYDKGQCRKIRKEYKQIVLRAFKQVCTEAACSAWQSAMRTLILTEKSCRTDFEPGYDYHTCGICCVL